MKYYWMEHNKYKCRNNEKINDMQDFINFFNFINFSGLEIIVLKFPDISRFQSCLQNNVVKFWGC